MKIKARTALLVLLAMASFAPAVALAALGGGGVPPGGQDVLSGAEAGFRVTARLEPAAQAPSGPVVAWVQFTCPEGWYIYSDSVSVKLQTAGGKSPVLKQGALRPPRVKSKYDKFLEQEVDYFDGQFTAELDLSVPEDAPAGEHKVTLRAGYQGCSPTVCFLHVWEDFQLDLTVLPAASAVATVTPPVQPPAAPTQPAQPPAEKPSEASAASGAALAYEEALTQRGFFVSLLIAYLAGLALVFTPCVYPMIPVTISLVGATATERKLSAFTRSLVYVLGVSLTFALLGLVAAATGRAFGTLLQHPAVYLALAALFIAMAFAMFEWFSIQLPSTWAARLQSKLRGRAGLLGLFLIGLLSGIAVTPCAAPVMFGAMGYVLKTNNLAAGFFIMFAVALGMGTPLVVLGTFGGLLRSLPKSGEWQQAVKHVFGYLLLGAGVFFIGKSEILPDRWFDMLVGCFLLVLSVFIGAFDQLEASSGWFQRARKAVGLLLLVAALSAFIRPLAAGRGAPEESIQWVNSEQHAIELATKQGKPIMFDFWQERCPACDQLDLYTYTDPRIIQESRRFVCGRIDGTNSWEPEVNRILRKYRIRGFPTLVFVDSSGKIVQDRLIVGFVEADELLKVMKSVRQEASIP